MCMWMTTCYACKTRLHQNDDKQTRYPHKFVYALKSESLLIHPKILTRKSESVLIHSVQINGNPLFIKKSTKIFLEHIGFKTNQVKDTMIIGGGSAAYYLADQLIRSGISVKIIENSRERCEELSILLPKAVIINGDGTDEELLKEEGITEAESFVPLTGIDEENIMLTLHAKQVSNAKVITKINRITFKNVINSLDLGSVIYPKYITSEAIIAYVRAKNDSMESTDSNSADSSASDSNIETLYHMFDHRVEAIEFRVTKSSAVTGKPLAELKLNDEILISFINRNGTIIIPSGQDCILEGDTVMIVTTHTGFTDIQDILR